jgi:uncharacterized membrane protein YdcZ (DUF606 family)
MGLLQDHGLGRDARVYVAEETTKGTRVRAAAGHAVRVLSVEVPPALGQERTPRRDHRQGRADVERIAGKETLPWSATGYLIPSGVAGTAPDADPLLEAGIGSGGGSGATYVYSPSNTQSPFTISITFWLRVFMLALWGAWVDEFSISGQGADPIKLKWSGGALGRARTGSSTLLASMSSSTSVTVQGVDEDAFDAGAIVSVGSNDNSDSGYLVTAAVWVATIDVGDYTAGSGDTITLAARTDKGPISVTLTEGVDFTAATSNDATATDIASTIDALDLYSASAVGSVVTVVAIAAVKYLAATSSDATAWTAAESKRLTIESAISATAGDAVLPHTPAPTTTGTVIAGISGSLTLDGVSVPVTAFEFSSKQNVKAVDDEAFAALPTDAINGYLEASGKLSLRLRRDQVRWLGHNAWRPMALSIVMGDSTTPGHYATLSVPRAEIARVPVAVPEADEVTIDVEFVALAASANPTTSADQAFTLTIH